MAAEVCVQEDLVLEPISFGDIKWAAPVENGEHGRDGTDGEKYFSAAMAASSKRKREPSTSSTTHKQAQSHWRLALMKARCHSDPWENFHLEDCPTERANRHRYNALKKEWVVDEVSVKMQQDPFAHGAMRECYRIKKLSNFSHNQVSSSHFNRFSIAASSPT